MTQNLKSFAEVSSYTNAGSLGSLPGVLKVPPMFQHGNLVEIIGRFGGSDQLRHAVKQLQTLLYAA